MGLKPKMGTFQECTRLATRLAHGRKAKNDSFSRSQEAGGALVVGVKDAVCPPTRINTKPKICPNNTLSILKIIYTNSF